MGIQTFSFGIGEQRKTISVKNSHLKKTQNGDTMSDYRDIRRILATYSCDYYCSNYKTTTCRSELDRPCIFHDAEARSRKLLNMANEPCILSDEDIYSHLLDEDDSPPKYRKSVDKYKTKW